MPAFKFHNTETVILFVHDAGDFTLLVCVIIRYSGVLVFDIEDYNMLLGITIPCLIADLDMSTHLLAVSIRLPFYHDVSVYKGHLAAHVYILVDLTKMIKLWLN